MIALVTGSNGFIGRHLVEALSRNVSITKVHAFDLGSTEDELIRGLAEADIVYHLAGINRPKSNTEFQEGNVGFTSEICTLLETQKRCPVIVFASSIQAALDNPYGASKRQAEMVLEQWSERTEGKTFIFRFKNVFGKWCRPNYNSVVATFCHNIAHDIPITITDESRELELVYIDDVIDSLVGVLTKGVPGKGGGTGAGAVVEETSVGAEAPTRFREVPRSFRATLGELATLIRSFRASRATLELPSFSSALNRCLYATYLSYLDGPAFSYDLVQRHDQRGVLAEFIKSQAFGQIFVSRTKPGIVRGNHFHHTKTEKFLILEGNAVVRFRAVGSLESARVAPTESEVRVPIHDANVIEHRISGTDFRVVDIPPGYTHSIENVGKTELVVLFWASEIFDPERPDTIASSVLS
jgi:UDP-2-acetamido-2,6-beta-L-arabino-hexul-4-ose reductase